MLISHNTTKVQPVFPVQNKVMVQENVVNPFRSGTVKISVGKTTYQRLTQAFIMIDNLDWLFRLKPSFVMLMPSEKALLNNGDRTNIVILYPRYADQELEFNVLSKGKASLRTYFFGEPKEDRMFDLFFRFFETGFKLSHFEGLEKSIFKFHNGTELKISSEKYRHPTIITGNTNGEFKVNARISREN